MMFGVVTIVSFILLTGTCYGEQRCKCNLVHHNQDQFCNSAFALHVRILSEVRDLSTLPGDEIPFYPTHMKYDVEILETFKNDGISVELLTDYMEDGFLEVYAPKVGLCGKPALFNAPNNPSNEYLFVGDRYCDEEDQPECQKLVITNCNWVQPWKEVEEPHRVGLGRMYSQCDCKIKPVSVRMIGEFSYDSCFYNPVKAETLRVADCESEFGYCVRQDTATCRWESNDAFDQCFQARKQVMSVSAAAVTSKEGCKIYSGRKKIQCIKKFRMNRNNALAKK